MRRLKSRENLFPQPSKVHYNKRDVTHQVNFEFNASVKHIPPTFVNYSQTIELFTADILTQGDVLSLSWFLKMSAEKKVRRRSPTL